MLESLLKPRSIAIIGASHDPEKLGHVILYNLITYRYRGRLYPVNPKGGLILGKKVFSSVQEIPAQVDLAIVVIPAALVPAAIRECGKKKIRTAIIISAGFAEQGGVGAQLEARVLAEAKKYHMRILGPNCLGVINPALKMNASFAAGMPDFGGVAVISQSGAMAVSITEWAVAADVGFSSLVSLGNKSDIQEEELVKYFGADKRTHVIVMYLESLKTGRALLRTIQRVSKKTPIIILKPGKSLEAQRAVASHTGAIAGAHAVQQAMLQSAGAVVVDTLQELFLFTQLFENRHKLSGNRVAIVTNAGGPGIIATDAVVAATNLRMATLAPQTIAELKKKLPEAAATGNPVDVIGDATPARYQIALRALMRDRGVDAVVALLTHQYVTDSDAIAKIIIREQRAHPGKPIAVSFIGGAAMRASRQILTKAGIITFAYPEHAVAAIAMLRHDVMARTELRRFPEMTYRTSQATQIVLGTRAERMVKRFVPYVMPSRLASSIEAALKQAARLRYPVVAKIISQEFIHKTERGGVQINITGPEQLRRTLRSWQTQFKLAFAKDEGFLLQPYRPGMIEMIIGAKRDPELGAYLVIGLGGIFVESIGGQVIVPIPASRAEIERALDRSLQGLLSTARGARIPKKDIIQCALGISRMMLATPRLEEFDANPVLLSAGRIEIADLRIVVRR
ncbi:MAG: acetate--CoA ligase family protein [Candidatus Kerfeldbacteria bacterium]|nr:acetate--CoA ligase family protein [Candidatus Kerfeldbacteria bacterium]